MENRFAGRRMHDSYIDMVDYVQWMRPEAWSRGGSILTGVMFGGLCWLGVPWYWLLVGLVLMIAIIVCERMSGWLNGIDDGAKSWRKAIEDDEQYRASGRRDGP